MTTTEQRVTTSLLASSYSKLLPPALVLVLVVVLAGIKAGLGVLGAFILVSAIILIPGLLYKLSKVPFRKMGIPDHLRVNSLIIFTLTGSIVCFAIPLPSPVPLTVAALLIGNIGLVVLRRWLNASGHVSVLTFAVLWVMGVYGPGWSWLLVLSPLMLMSRVTLKEHTVREALAGAALGVATFLCFLIATFWS